MQTNGVAWTRSSWKLSKKKLFFGTAVFACFRYVYFHMHLFGFRDYRATVLSNSFASNASVTTSDQSVSSAFLFPKDSVHFKPTTRISEHDCNPLPSQPLKHVRSFPNYNQTKIKGDYDTSLAICQFLYPDKSIAGSHHFPHVMQKLYLCYTYWQTNPSRVPVLYTNDKSGMDQIFQGNQFLRGFVQLLESEMKVKVLTNKGIKDWLEATTVTEGVPASKNNDEIDVARLRRMELPNQPVSYALSHVDELNKMAGRRFELDNTNSHPGSTSINGTTCPIPTIAILNRMLSSKRSITNPNQLIDKIVSEMFSGNNTPVLEPRTTTASSVVSLEYFEERTFEQQIRFLRGVDILISPHGAQLTGIPFMANKPCTQLIEFFPHNYLLPDFFGSLARGSGIEYSYIYVTNSSTASVQQAQTMGSGRISGRHRRERIIARYLNLCLDPKVVANAVRESITNWCECKRANNKARNRKKS